MPTPTSPLSNGSKSTSRLPVFHNNRTSSSSPTNLKRVNDELRQHISRLKSELEIEKAKTKQVHRDKVADIKRLKDEFDKEKFHAAGSVVQKLKNEHIQEIRKLKESLQKEKEIEVKHIIKFKDEELKTTKKMLIEDKEFALKELEEKLKKELTNKPKDSNDIDLKLKLELTECRKQKQNIEELYKQKCASETDKIELIRKLKEDHDKETHRVLRDARIQIARNVSELKAAQKALSEKEQQITKRELELSKLEEEKEYLSDKLKTDSRRSTDLLENNAATSRADKELQTKNVELRKIIEDLTRKVSILERDNALKRSDSREMEHSSSRTDQRIKELKKRNGELVTLAKKLEEKAKRLQEELRECKSKGMLSRIDSTESSATFESVKRNFALQRAKDLAENAKATLMKNKEMSRLKDKIAELEKQEKGKTEDTQKIEQLERRIHQMEEEKLSLEEQLSEKNKELLLQPDKESLASKEKELQAQLQFLEQESNKMKKSIDDLKAENSNLKEKIEELNQKSRQFDILARELEERNEECTALAKDLQSNEKETKELKDILTETQRINKKLENEKEKSRHVVKNLQSKMEDMSKKLVEMDSLELECKMLKDSLQDAVTKHSMMEGQLESLQGKVAELKKVEQDLEESREQCKTWERDYDYAVQKINQQNKDLVAFQEEQGKSKQLHEQQMEDLKEEISRLEEICVDLEEDKKSYLALLETSKKAAKVDREMSHVYVQTSRPVTPVQQQKETVIETVVPEFEKEVEALLQENFQMTVNVEDRDFENVKDGSEHESPPRIEDDDILDVASSRIAALAVNSSSEDDLSIEDRPVPTELCKPHAEGSGIQPTKHDKEKNKDDRNRTEDLANESDTSDELTLSLDEMESEDEELDIPADNNNEQFELNELNESDGSKHLINALRDTSSMKRRRYQEKRISNDSVFASISPYSSVDELIHEKKAATDFAQAYSSNDRLTVFMAQYTYDPFKHSPNEDPGLELALEAGDYVYVFGDADEDGFYIGELVNGQRGLVPSNFVKKISDENEHLNPIVNGYDTYPGAESDEDLTEVSRSVSPSDSIAEPEAIQPLDNDVPLDAEYLKNTPRPTSNNEARVSDVFNEDEKSFVSEGEEMMDKIGLPPPEKLKLERQLNNSIVISWLPPHGVTNEEIQGYLIKADGLLKQTLIGANRTKAIVSDIDRDKVYRISVHTVNRHGKEAAGSMAVITVGKGANAIPADLRIQSLSPRSADLEWTCGNSSLAHCIFMNGKELHIVNPGIDRFHLGNLVPDHQYEINIEARPLKNGNKSNNGAVLSDALIFRTPPGGLPEPPLNVQVKLQSDASSEVSLQVSWLPVTIKETGISNGAIVDGYKIYIEEAEIIYVDSPTADHVSVSLKHLNELRDQWKGDSIKLWLRSQSAFGQSVRSEVVVLTDDILDAIRSYNQKVLDVDRITESENGESSFKGSQANFKKNVVETKPKKDENNDIDEKIQFVNATLEEQKPMETQSSLKDQIPPGDEADSNISKSANNRKEICDGKTEAPLERFKGKPTVIKYDVFDSEDSDDDDDDDDEEDDGHDDDNDDIEIQYIEMKTTEDDADLPNENSSHHPEDNGAGSMHAEERETSCESKPTDNLVLPEIPPPDYDNDDDDDDADDEDDVEIKPNIRISFDDLLSDDSELSAIEEETVEDLLEYHKTDDQSISPGHTFSLPDDGMNNGTQKGDPNRTYSIHDDDDDDGDVDGRKASAGDNSKSAKKVSKTSKESVSFGSDDVVDMLDNDFIEGPLDLPLDEEKNTQTESKTNRTKIVTVENQNYSQISTSTNEMQKPSVIQANDLPAKRAPVQTNDQQTDKGKDEKFGQSMLKKNIRLVNNTIPGSSHSGDSPREFSTDIKADGKDLNEITQGRRDNGEIQTKTANEDISSNEPMGQVIEPLSGNHSECYDENEDENPIKIPKASVHDLYTFHVGGSFDESILDSEPEHKSDVTSKESHGVLEDSAVEGNNENLKSSPKDEPAIGNNVGTVESESIDKQPVEGLHGIDYENDSFAECNGKLHEGTRSNHVTDDSSMDNMRVFIALFSYDPITMSPNLDGVEEELAFNEGDLIKVFGDVDDDGFYYGELRDKRGFVPSNMVQEVSLNNFEQSFNVPPPPVNEDESSQDLEDGGSKEDRRKTSVAKQQRKASTNSLNRGKLQNSASVKRQNSEKLSEVSQTNSSSSAVNSDREAQNEHSEMENVVADLENIDIQEDNRNYRYISERESIYCLQPKRMIALYDYDPVISSPNVDSEVELSFNKGDIILIFGDMDEDGFFAAENNNERGLVPSNFLEECADQHNTEEIEIDMGAASPSINTSSRKSSTSSIGAASPIESQKKKKKGILAKGKKIFSKLKGK